MTQVKAREARVTQEATAVTAGQILATGLSYLRWQLLAYPEAADRFVSHTRTVCVVVLALKESSRP